jgi:hypothetical protein
MLVLPEQHLELNQKRKAQITSHQTILILPLRIPYLLLVLHSEHSVEQLMAHTMERHLGRRLGQLLVIQLPNLELCSFHNKGYVSSIHTILVIFIFSMIHLPAVGASVGDVGAALGTIIAVSRTR